MVCPPITKSSKLFQATPTNLPENLSPWSHLDPRVHRLKSPGAQLVFLPPSLLLPWKKSIFPAQCLGSWEPRPGSGLRDYLYWPPPPLSRLWGREPDVPIGPAIAIVSSRSSCSRLSSQSIPFILVLSAISKLLEEKGCSIPDIRGKNMNRIRRCWEAIVFPQRAPPPPPHSLPSPWNQGGRLCFAFPGECDPGISPFRKDFPAISENLLHFWVNPIKRSAFGVLKFHVTRELE